MLKPAKKVNFISITLYTLDMRCKSASETILILDIEITDVRQNEYGIVISMDGEKHSVSLDVKELSQFCSTITQHTEADIRRRAFYSLTIKGLPKCDILGEHKVTRRWIKEYLD